MKLTNKILEAVNRGIKFALDDFEDNDLQGQTNSKVKYNHGTKDWLDFMNEIIDLGLPSGTLWCKYNLGCDYKLLEYNPEKTKPEDWYGDYYSWGELEPNKDQWNEASYKFTGKMKKYNNYDKLINLLPEDDAAYQYKNQNYKFHIPTKEQFEELLKYTTTSKYQENYNNVDGLNGYILISNINNNEIFIPEAGHWNNLRGFYKNSIMMSCATRYEKDPYRCYVLHYYSEITGFILNNTSYRTYGFPIRPVINL